jgi:hypothetical protein
VLRPDPTAIPCPAGGCDTATCCAPAVPIVPILRMCHAEQNISHARLSELVRAYRLDAHITATLRLP